MFIVGHNTSVFRQYWSQYQRALDNMSHVEVKEKKQ